MATRPAIWGPLGSYRICSYNPLSLVHVGRTREVHKVLGGREGHHVIGMQGTRLAAQTKDVQLQTVEGYSFFNFGYPTKGNCHTGVSLSFCRRRFRPKHFVSVANPKSGPLAGRVAAVRTKTPTTDHTWIVAYMPPHNHGGAQKVMYQKVLQWIQGLIAKLPKRTTPIIITDANAALGFEDSEMGSGLSGELTAVIGTSEPAAENLNGRMFREFLEMTAMTPINTHFEAGPTYHSAHNLHTSRIDYVCIPVEQLAQCVMSCKVLRKEGAAMQLINTVGPADHLPLSVQIRCRMSFHVEEQTKQTALTSRSSCSVS
jgi:exonuclease III